MKKLIFLAFAAAALSACNSTPEVYFARGNQLYSSGKDSLAMENYNKALLLRRSYPEALVSRGMLYERMGDRQKAGQDYRKALELKPGYLPAYNNLGAMLMDGGNYAEAVKLFTAALDANKDYPYALLNRGLALYKQGDCGAATADLSRALELNPKFEMAYYHRALCARKAKNLPKGALQPGRLSRRRAGVRGRGGAAAPGRRRSVLARHGALQNRLPRGRARRGPELSQAEERVLPGAGAPGRPLRRRRPEAAGRRGLSARRRAGA
jgi:Tfp pilus assembly protein PilF